MKRENKRGKINIMKSILEKVKKIAKNTLTKVIFINLIVFILSNIVFGIKYEEVDDFIIYNLYSGLDGTYNIHGVYIHSALCFIISLLYRILPMINWHTIFLLCMQFICFTIIGNILLKKNENKFSYILYILFVSVFYTILLQLIQYTSIAALLILTSFFAMMDGIEKEEKKKRYIILTMVLFTIGIMLRMQSLLIVAPFYAIYLCYNYILKIKNKVEKQKILNICKQYLILGIITILVYGSNYLIYNTNDLYKEYTQYNEIRTMLHDLSFILYDTNKEIFEEIGWSRNDYALFYRFNFGDENVYSKENLQKIINYKNDKKEYLRLNLNIKKIINIFKGQTIYINSFIVVIFMLATIIAIYTNKSKRGYIISIFLATIFINVLFIILNRSIQRVVIPEYIIGTMMMLYLTHYKEEKKQYNSTTKLIVYLVLILILISTNILVAKNYNKGYKIDEYKDYKELINYTNSNKQNVYLYTVDLYRGFYLAYSVYEMPPKNSFSNLRVMGGWDMFTGNYYDFKDRYNLDGIFLDLLKENVYLVDKENKSKEENLFEGTILFLKENYNKEVTYEQIQKFGEINIYKIKEK